MAAALHSFKTSFIPLICRCYVFLYIHLPFDQWFLKMPDLTLFCFSKEERFRILIGLLYQLIFLFQSSNLLNRILSFQRFDSRTESFLLCLLTIILGVILNFLSTFLHFLSTFSVYHLHNFAYLFIVLGFTLGFTLGFILGCTQSFGVHIIVLPFYSMKNGKCENITLFQVGLCENIG